MRLKSFAVIGAILMSATAYAENYKFCFESWAPYADKVEGKGIVGSTAEFVTAVMKELGHGVTLELIDSPERCGAEVKAGNMAGMFFNSPGAIAGGHDSVITEYWLVAAIVRNDNPMEKFTGIDAFKGKSVGTVGGYEYPKELGGFKGMKVEKVMEADQNLKKIAAGRIDVTFDDPVWAETESKRNGYGLKALAPLVAIDGTHVTFGPKLKDLRDKFTSKAEEMIKAGVLDKLYEKHAGITMKAFKTKYGIK